MDDQFSPRALEIIGCARKLIIEGGYNAFSYADISEAVGISKASIHHHFPSKADLVKTVVSKYREEARMGLGAIRQMHESPLEQLRVYTGYWEACIADGSGTFCLCAMLAAEMPRIPEEIAKEVQGHFQELSAWIASVLKAGVNAGLMSLHGSAKVEAMSLMALVHGALLSSRATSDAKVFRSIIHPALQRLANP